MCILEIVMVYLTLTADKRISLHDMLNGTEIIFPRYEPPKRVSTYSKECIN